MSFSASKANLISPISFFQIVKDYCHIYIICNSAHTAANALVPVFNTVETEIEPIWPTFITLIHNMTLLHHLSTQHFSSPKALVTEVTDGDCVCVFLCMFVCICVWRPLCTSWKRGTGCV